MQYNEQPTTANEMSSQFTLNNSAALLNMIQTRETAQITQIKIFQHHFPNLNAVTAINNDMWVLLLFML